MAKGRPKSESGHESDSSDTSSGSSSSNSSSSSDSSGKSSRESSPDQRDRRKTQRSTKSRRDTAGSTEGRGRQLKKGSQKKQRGKDKSKHVSGDSPKHRKGRDIGPKHVLRSPSHSPPPSEALLSKQYSRGAPRLPSASPPGASQESSQDTNMLSVENASGARSEDELSIGPGGDNEYQDELVQEANDASQEVTKKSKPRREDLSSGEVTSDGDSEDSFSWRENRVRTMLQSHVEKPSNEGQRESYDRYESDHEGTTKPFRSVVGTTISRPGQHYSDSDSGEITDSEEEGERDRKTSRERYSRRPNSPSRHSNRTGQDRDHRQSRTEESSSNQRNGNRDNRKRDSRDKPVQEYGQDKRRDHRHPKDGGHERTDAHRKEKHREHKKDEQYQDAKVKFRKRVWDKKEEQAQENFKAQDVKSAEEEKKETKDKAAEEPPPPKKKKEAPDILTTRTGGAYIPPAKLRMMQEQITDKSSVAYQRMSWEALKKSINGLINKVNVSNIAMIVQELLQLNIVRGRGLLAKSIIAAQTASPSFTHVYAALVAIINTKFPQNGELMLRRLVINFKKGYRRNDKTLCLSSTRFLAHLVNQQVAHEILSLEILTLLLENVTDDSTEVAVGFVKECGLKLQEVSPRGIHAIFERLRNILHEAKIEKRVQYMVEVVFANRKDGFKDFPSVVPELDLVEEADQFTHLLTLEENYQSEDLLNVFKDDPEFLENEEKYKAIKKQILEEDSDDSDSDGESGEASSSGDESGEEKAEAEKMEIIDKTETDLVALRRIIYLTIQSSLDFEECAHKMLKMDFKPGQEREVSMMIIDCCAQQRTYEKFFGLLSQRFCQLKREYVQEFQSVFPEQYAICHRLDTNKLRNVAKLFAHLLHTDAISWTVMEAIRMNEEDTTSSSRIFVKILFLELSEYLGLPKLNGRLQDKTLLPYFEGLLPRDNPANTRFSINFFTTIGLGGLTDDLRDHLKNVQRQIMQQRQPVLPSDSSSDSSDSDSESSSSSSSDSSSDSSSGSSVESDHDKSKKRKKRSSKVIQSKSTTNRREDDKGRDKQRKRVEEKNNRSDRQAERNNRDTRRKKVDDREIEDSRTRTNDRDRIENRTRQNDTRHDRVNNVDEDLRQAKKNNRDRDEMRGKNSRTDHKLSRSNEKHSKKEESDSSESDDSSSSSESSSDSESSIDSSPQKEALDRQAKGNPNRERAVRPIFNDHTHQGRGGRDIRENYSDKENQRGNRLRTQSYSDSEGFQKRRDTGRDFIRHDDFPNNEYVDHRQVRGDGRDIRGNREDYYDRGNMINPRTRYNSRGEDDHMNMARNRHERMEVDGFDRRNDDRGRNRYENDNAPPPRYNEDAYGRKDRRQGYAGSPERSRRDYGGGNDRGMRREREYHR